jgi:multisubunit Na+/H+ antiporter MnhE subunit
MAARVARLALPWAASAAVLFALWLFIVDTAESPQLYAGIAVAAIAATGSELVRRQRIAMVRPRARWLPRLWRPAASVPADLWRLARAAARGLRGAPPDGRFLELPFEPGDGDPEDLARQALAEAAGSFSPNTVVIGVDDERRTLLAHQLLEVEEPARSLDPLGLG